MSATFSDTERPRITNRAACLHGVIVRIATGDQVAFRELYDHCSAMVFGIALDATGDRAEAETVAMDVFVAIWQRSSEFDPSALSPVEWILSLVGPRATERIGASIAGQGRPSQSAPVLATR